MLTRGKEVTLCLRFSIDEGTRPVRPITTSPTTEAISSTWRLSALVVTVLTAAGAFIRVQVADQSLFADELSTYWIVTGRGLGSVLSTVYSHAEISPPAFFVASWLTTQLGDGPEFVRLPSLIAGIATIPLIYLLGLRLVDRATGTVAAALTTFSPFMIYYSADARGYALMMFLVALSTFTMLNAADSRRVHWWVAYAIATCAVVYTHYTGVFVLGAQLSWLLWAHPTARRTALWANLAAVVGFLPWMPGVVQDFRSWTLPILFGLQPFTLHSVGLSLEHWTIGYPYAIDRGAIDLPGPYALGLLAVALLLALTGLGRELVRRRQVARPRQLPSRMVLVVLLAISVPVGAAICSSVGVQLFSVRGLAASWPGFALVLATLLCAAGPRLGYVAAALAVTAFALGGHKLLTEPYQRPDYRTAADFIDRQARPGDVVLDHTAVLSPGPLSGVDVAFRRTHRVFRAGAPQERDHPFGLQDPRVPLEQAVSGAIAAADGGRIFMVSHGPLPETLGQDSTRTTYRLVDAASYAGFVPVFVGAYAPHPLRNE